jgi:hypothetical protein
MKELNKIPSKHLIVQHNDLIASKYDLNLSEMRLILEAIRNVEKDDADFKEYEIDVESFLELVDSKNVSEYSRVKEFCKTILSKPLEIPRGDGKYMWCNWFSNIEYDEKKRSEKYKEFIKREIEIINPDYIICCGSYWQIIDHVYDYFKSKKEWENRKKSEPDIDMYYKLNIKGKIVPAFNVFHPSAIKRNQEYVDLINNIFDKL